jgi:UDP:flavonoid glycosyltransferase YjiC (YdhE family)
MMAPEFNEFRRELGLPPIYRILSQWAHSKQLTLGLWPDWFAAIQPDWPPQVHLTGFPLYDAGSLEKVPDAMEAFLSSGRPPVIFTPGSAMRQGKRFFEESVAVCLRTGLRGALLTKFPEQVPAQLPSSVQRFGYVPFSQVLPRAAAFVHHGGIGTTSQALAAGVPQIIMPLSHDQPDNAARVRRLGVGIVIPPSEYHAPKVAEALNRFDREPSFRAKANEIRARFQGVNAIANSCDLIEKSFSAA